MSILKKMAAGSKHLTEQHKEEVPQEVLQAMLVEEMSCITMLYQMALSLKNYRKAFGEDPEFVRFFEKQCPPGVTVDKWIASTEEMFSFCCKQLGKNRKGETLKSHGAFGTMFLQHSESIKLKGE